jgi:type II secretory pathway component PulC
MAEDKQTTPEQQLLKLIEGEPKTGKSGKAAQVKGTVRPSILKLPGALLGSLAFWKRSAKRKSYGKRFSFGLDEVNRILVLMTAILAVYVVFDAVASARNLQRPPIFVPPKDLRVPIQKESIAPLEETSYYLQKISSRDIFKEGVKEERPKAETPVQAVATETAETIQNLALVGISWSSNPDAIIEDKGHQRTYFVKRGQMVGEDVKVEAIFKDHVVVTYEDREYELR